MIQEIFNIIVYPGLLFTVVLSLVYSGILRKLAARMQSRIGPPVWQPFLDIIKLFGKEEITPEQAKPGFGFWPFVAFASILIAALLTPVAGMVSLDSGNFIVLIYFLVFSPACLYLAGLASSNPYAVVGSIRGLVQMFSYEIIFVVSLVVPMLFVNSLEPLVINNYQLGSGWIASSFPLAAAAFLVAVLAKLELPPFHTPEAHQEIVSGYYTEYSGFRLALIEMTHIVKIFVLLSLAVAVFFGGSGDPLIFIIKTLALLILLSVIRVVLARFRIDHVLKFCWILGVIALIDLIRVLMV